MSSGVITDMTGWRHCGRVMSEFNIDIRTEQQRERMCKCDSRECPSRQASALEHPTLCLRTMYDEDVTVPAEERGMKDLVEHHRNLGTRVVIPVTALEVHS